MNKDLRFLKNKRMGLIYGGLSNERPVALLGLKAVEQALKDLELKYFKFDLNKNSRKKVFTFIERKKIEVVFLMLHGKYGEDGTIQGGLEVMGVPYTGSRTLASAVALDKVVSKQLMLAHKIPTPVFEVLEKGKKVSLPLPFVVKPADGGSTLGISIVKKASAEKKALNAAFKCCGKVLAEKYIAGREITVPVFEDRALEIIEIIPKTAFYDYKAKYVKGMSLHILPAKLPAGLYRKAQALAEKVHKALELKDFSRVDIIIGKNKKLYVLEVNTLPGLTGTSLLPEAAKYAGLSFAELTAKMLRLAFKN